MRAEPAWAHLEGGTQAKKVPDRGPLFADRRRSSTGWEPGAVWRRVNTDPGT